jgi:hypothetical protein
MLLEAFAVIRFPILRRSISSKTDSLRMRTSFSRASRESCNRSIQTHYVLVTELSL